MNEDVPSRELSYPTLEKRKFIFNNAFYKGIYSIYLFPALVFPSENERFSYPSCHVSFQVFFFFAKLVTQTSSTSAVKACTSKSWKDLVLNSTHDDMQRFGNRNNQYIPRTQLTSIFEGQASKTRPFPIKKRVSWVLRCIYT